MISRVTELARAEGLDLDYDPALRVNTLDAPRGMHLATERAWPPPPRNGCCTRISPKAPISLTPFAGQLARRGRRGSGRVRDTLAGTEYADAVRADAEEADTLGANGVPFFVIDRKYGIPGAQPAQVFLGVLRKAYAAGTRLDVVRIASLGSRTDVALRVLEGAGHRPRDYLVLRTPDNPDPGRGFLLLDGLPGPGQGGWLARLAGGVGRPGTSRSASTLPATPRHLGVHGRRARNEAGDGADHRTDPLAGPAEHRSRDPAAGPPTTTGGNPSTWPTLLRRRRAGRLPGAAGGGPATADPDRRRGLARRVRRRAACSPSSGCSTSATATPAAGASRPSRRTAAGAWPEP